MKRTQTKVPYGPTESRFRVVIESDPCPPRTLESRRFQFELLSQMAADPMLTACGPAMFETMKWRHNGACWIVELEAIVPEVLR